MYYRRNADSHLRSLERRWQASQDSEALLQYAVALIRSGDALRAFTILLENDAHLIIKELTKNGCPPLIPSFPDGAKWGPSTRFEIERVSVLDNEWQLNDYVYGNYFTAESRNDARELLAFAEAYVQRHGDIDLNAFPGDLDSPLHYDNIEGVVRHWIDFLPGLKPGDSY